jgi:hypothetical protein
MGGLQPRDGRAASIVHAARMGAGDQLAAELAGHAVVQA